VQVQDTDAQNSHIFIWLTDKKKKEERHWSKMLYSHKNSTQSVNDGYN